VADLFGGAHLFREIIIDEVRAGGVMTGRGLGGRADFSRRGQRARGRGEAPECHGQYNHTECDQENPPVLDEETDNDEGEEGPQPTATAPALLERRQLVAMLQDPTRCRQSVQAEVIESQH
jgi:hypothetical protein